MQSRWKKSRWRSLPRSRGSMKPFRKRSPRAASTAGTRSPTANVSRISCSGKIIKYTLTSKGSTMSSKEPKKEQPPYLERIDELEKVSIVRLKGEITREMIPVIEKRIQDNRRLGSKIEKNVIIDFAKVVDVDS